MDTINSNPELRESIAYVEAKIRQEIRVRIYWDVENPLTEEEMASLNEAVDLDITFALEDGCTQGKIQKYYELPGKDGQDYTCSWEKKEIH